MSIAEIFRKIFDSGSDPAMPDKKPGRNEPCWCGSGKKYKHCHLDADERKRTATLNASACRGST